MGYKRAFVHRMAEELEKLAYDGEQDELADEDVQGIILSLFEMHKPLDDDLANLAVSIYECRTGGMYEAFEELPDILDDMVDAIAKHHGFKDKETFLVNELGIEQLVDQGGFVTGIYIKR